MRNYISFILFVVILISNCHRLTFNNPADVYSKEFLETEFLKCILGDFYCIEFPQDNQGIKQWTKLVGASGSFSTYGNATAVDRVGNVYLLGTTTGAVLNQTKISPTLYNDILLIKYDPNGNLLWSKQMGSPINSSTYAEQLFIDSFGFVYFVGAAAGPFNEYNGSGSGSIVVKLTDSGDVLWTKIVPTGGESLGYGITSDPSGNIYITGNTEETVLNGQTAAGGRNTFIFKYDQIGNLVWTKLYDDSGISTYGQSILYEPISQSLLVAGQTGGSGEVFGVVTPGDSTDSYLLSLNLNGDFQWIQFLGGVGISTQTRGIGIDKKGSIYVTGDTNGNLDGITKDGTTVQYLTRYDTNGKKYWTRLLGGGGSALTYSYALYADNSFHIYTFGGSQGTVNGTNTVGNRDALLTKYDTDGNLIWTKLTGGTSLEVMGRGISSDRYGALYVSGYTSGSIDDQAKQGTYDAFLMKYQ